MCVCVYTCRRILMNIYGGIHVFCLLSLFCFTGIGWEAWEERTTLSVSLKKQRKGRVRLKVTKRPWHMGLWVLVLKFSNPLQRRAEARLSFGGFASKIFCHMHYFVLCIYKNLEFFLLIK